MYFILIIQSPRYFPILDVFDTWKYFFLAAGGGHCFAISLPPSALLSKLGFLLCQTKNNGGHMQYVAIVALSINSYARTCGYDK